MAVVVLVSSKDVRLPVLLQRAMAAEAEAAREARAKVSDCFFSSKQGGGEETFHYLSL